MQSQQAPSDKELTNSFITSTGAKIFYRDFRPSSERNLVPLLCLHGFLRNSRDFTELGGVLAEQGVRVIIPDLRGRGSSERFTDHSKYHYDLIKQDVVDLLDHLELARVAILGTALGAAIGMDLVAELNGRVTGLVLNDQGTEVNQTAAKKMSGNVEAADYSFDEAVERMKLHFGEAHPGLSYARWENLTRRVYAETAPGRWARDLDMGSMSDVPRMVAERPDLWLPFLATRGTPVAILRGVASEYFAANCAQRMIEQHREAVLTTIQGRGHPLLLDEPESLPAIFNLLERASY
ncbi:alpha/beta hydrolase [Pseudomonas sp. C11]|uniref:alpha/beta fold hydrolase n=1 Tax=Pseudomonas sp. C11 TaxID=3075550 RepID=UPI002AFE6DB4|nr:alpha/beta hydrolase [Pseudomonas sp. C11]